MINNDFAAENLTPEDCAKIQSAILNFYIYEHLRELLTDNEINILNSTKHPMTKKSTPEEIECYYKAAMAFELACADLIRLKIMTIDEYNHIKDNINDKTSALTLPFPYDETRFAKIYDKLSDENKSLITSLYN